MRLYADTNLIVSLFVEGPNTAEAQRLYRSLDSGGNFTVPVSLLCRLEVVNALQQTVFFTQQGVPGMCVSREYAMAAEAIFFEQVTEGTKFRSAQIDEILLERQFHNLVHRHTAREGFRTYDILHVASALVLGCDTFWSFDAKAKKLARLEGLAVN